MFFPMGNFHVPTTILDVAENVENFGTSNWFESIRKFLVNEFNAITKKKNQEVIH
ncbi:hypothetical protein KFK09_002357 [Dendrobium nobile]|uniref:Uncharacterized protein n=1 Tax=Dendrobium nobile TaxID=94219 RepID=A0A8T3C6V4_DENNO|nr:hypothetical protein KFK09_002357 [Dendrobium nobile]